MGTEGDRRVGAFIADEMTRAGMARADVIKAGPIDNKTLQSVLEGARRSTSTTRTKIENALNLAPGTLNAVERGEMPTRTERRRVSDTELIAMLADRLSSLRTEVEELRSRATPDATVTPLTREPYVVDEAAREDTGQPNPGEGDDE